jgi:hypothetical protein
MKTTLNSRKQRYLAKFSIFLVTLALVAGMVGCVESPFVKNLEIWTWYDLDDVRDNLDGHHTLMINLDSSTAGYNDTAGENGWKPIGNELHPFTGSFDGQKYEIEDLFINRNDDEVGLFGFVGSKGVIQDVTLVNANVTGYQRVGSLVGWNEGTVSNSYSTTGSVTGYKFVGGLVGRNEGTVSNKCYSTGSVTVSNDYVGGLVGENSGNVSDSHSTGSVTGRDGIGGLVGKNSGNVSDSRSTGNVTGMDGIGGLVGENTGIVSNNSYSSGSVTGESYVGGLVGRNKEGIVSNKCYSLGNVKGNVVVGGLVGYNEGGSVSDSHSTGSVNGTENIGGLVGCNYEESTVSDSYSKGSVNGTENIGGLVGCNYKSTVRNSHYNYDEVLINGQKMITTGALSNEDFRQWRTNDLDVTKRLSQDQENGYYEINNITDFKQLLAFGQNSSLAFILKNDLDLATEPNFYIPYFAGEFDGNGHKISNVSFNFDFVCNVGLFGYLDGIVTRLGVENVNITGASSVGGLVGYSWEGTVSDSYSTGNVISYGSCDSGLEDLLVSGVGGLVGSNVAGPVNSCNSSCSVTGNCHVGGLVGYNYGDEGIVSYSYSTGSVSGKNGVGGLVGRNLGTVQRSNSKASVTGSVPGSVTVGDVVGGLVGWNKGMVGESYSTGSVSGKNGVGGLVGWNSGTVSNSYSTGSVYGNRRVGGLVGRNYDDGTVNRTYSTGRVTGNDDFGGLVGKNYGDVSKISRSFWDTVTSGQATSDGGDPKTTEEMKKFSTFQQKRWTIWAVPDPDTRRNTTHLWNIVDGDTYPFLSWQS